MKSNFMLATLVDEPFDSKDWIFETKWDGYRAFAVKGKQVKLVSRAKKSFNARFPPIVRAVQALPGTFVLDGEIVVLDAKGRPHFQLLQNYQKTKEGALCYCVFDLLMLNGKDLRKRPLLERKDLLQKLLRSAPRTIRYSKHTRAKGVALFRAAARQGLEGIVAKKASSAYQSRRSLDWQKIKTSLRQEVVIGGFTRPRGARKKFGALLVGVYEQGKLLYAGHVGGGFNEKLLAEVHEKLQKHISSRCPFAEKPHPNMPVIWVKPQLVCEVSFAEWTRDGMMRQPIFKGMRIDKPPKKVVREHGIHTSQ